jgi:cytochrome c553
VVVPDKPGQSKLYQMVQQGLMPRDRKGGLPVEDVETIRAWIAAGALAEQAQPAALSSSMSEHDVIPLMLLHCTRCHGSQLQEGSLDLRTRASMLKGGQSGPALISGKPDESLMIQLIRTGKMPPPTRFVEAGVTEMNDVELQRLTKWVKLGAPKGNVQPDVASAEPDPLVTDEDRRFWAFQPPQPDQVPAMRHSPRVRNPIDAFTLRKLEQTGLTFSAEADRLTLIRRACFDLTGLPPEPEEVRNFLADPDPQAYEKLIDRLLASTRYGERQARDWLDLAGYLDHPHAYRYRDYVIRSFNADKPYDRFLLEQIAGDELVDYENASVITEQMMDNLTATGFLRMTHDPTGNRFENFIEHREHVVADEIEVFSSVVLGLTLQCARCHSHMFDPIPQRDYYRLVAIFKGAYDTYDWLPPVVSPSNLPVLDSGTRVLPYVTPRTNPLQHMEAERKRKAHNEKLGKRIKQLQAALDKLAEPFRKRVIDRRLAQLPQEVQDDLRELMGTPPEKRNERQKRLAKNYKFTLRISPPDLRKINDQYKKAFQETEQKIVILKAKQVPEPKIRALWDRGRPSPTYILKRGNPLNLGRLVGPGVPSVLTDGKTPFKVTPPYPGAKQTGRRLALAKWLAQPDHPLTARVMVNRIWKHYFGRGIVKSLGNFGRSGEQPTHPKLLDWLAVEFVRQNWSIKAMHRLIVTSSTYRQASQVTPAHQKLDSENLLISRMPLRRMDGEVLQDSMFLVSGRLNETQFGPPDPVQRRSDGLVTVIETVNGWRRSIYARQRLTRIPTTLDLFDYPQMTPNCVERSHSTVATQALHLMNDAMIRKLADSFAQRVRKEVGDDPRKQIERVFWIALSRPPTDEEQEIGLEAMTQFAKQWSRGQPSRHGTKKPQPDQQDANISALAKFCHTIFNSAAFIYID